MENETTQEDLGYRKSGPAQKNPTPSTPKRTADEYANLPNPYHKRRGLCKVMYGIYAGNIYIYDLDFEDTDILLRKGQLKLIRELP